MVFCTINLLNRRTKNNKVLVYLVYLGLTWKSCGIRLFFNINCWHRSMLFIIINPVNFNLWPSPLALLTPLAWRARFSVDGEVVAWVMRLEKICLESGYSCWRNIGEKKHQRSQDVSALSPVKHDAQTGEWCSFDKNLAMSMCVCGIFIKLALKCSSLTQNTSQSRKAAVADSGLTGTCCCVI